MRKDEKKAQGKTQWEQDNIEKLIHPALRALLHAWRQANFPTTEDFVRAQTEIMRLVGDPFRESQLKKYSAMQGLQTLLDLVMFILMDMKRQYEQEHKMKFKNMEHFVTYLYNKGVLKINLN